MGLCAGLAAHMITPRVHIRRKRACTLDAKRACTLDGVPPHTHACQTCCAWMHPTAYKPTQPAPSGLRHTLCGVCVWRILRSLGCGSCAVGARVEHGSVRRGSLQTLFDYWQDPALTLRLNSSPLLHVSPQLRGGSVENRFGALMPPSPSHSSQARSSAVSPTGGGRPAKPSMQGRIGGKCLVGKEKKSFAWGRPRISC